MPRMKDGEPLELSDRVRVEKLEDGTVRLTVEDLRPEDAGRYRMVASNGNGETCTESAVTVDREWRALGLGGPLKPPRLLITYDYVEIMTSLDDFT